MTIILGKVKCVFCNNKNGLIHSICDYGIYGEIGRRIHYHPECLELVQMYPESFGHRKVDMALKIIDMIQECKNFNKNIISKYEKKLEKLKISHFENMMPAK